MRRSGKLLATMAIVVVAVLGVGGSGAVVTANPDDPNFEASNINALAKSGEYPWMVYVNSCSGTLVAPQWVLVASHCSRTTDVRVGALTPNDGEYIKVDRREVVANRGIDPRGDLALLHLSKPASATPIGFEGSQIEKNLGAKALGYGRTCARTECRSAKLRSVDLATRFVGEDTFVTGANNGFKGVCYGDSGGPLIRYVNGSPLLIGVSVTTFDDANSGSGRCEGKSGHTAVGYYADKIASITGTSPASGNPDPPTPEPEEEVVVRARGNTGSEKIQVKVNGSTLETFTLGKSWADLSVDVSETVNTVEVRFFNNGYDEDGQDRNVYVDYVVANGDTYQTYSPSVSGTGIYNRSTRKCGAAPAPPREIIHCNGSFKYQIS